MTALAGVAGPPMRSVEVTVAGRRRALRLGPGRSFLAVVRGDVRPPAPPLTVRYRGGRRRTFAG